MISIDKWHGLQLKFGTIFNWYIQALLFLKKYL